MDTWATSSNSSSTIYDDFGIPWSAIDLGADTINCVSEAGDNVVNDICLLVN